jgi:hypothetical protein
VEAGWKTAFAHGILSPGKMITGSKTQIKLLRRMGEAVADFGMIDDGDRVMWTRQFSSNVDDRDCAELDESLKLLGARRMIVAHTVHEKITPKCDGKVWAIDVGMSRAYGGSVQVLEILNDEKLTVLRP